jgi:hypothetical protein
MANLSKFKISLPTTTAQKQIGEGEGPAAKRQLPTFEQVVQEYSPKSGVRCMILFDATGSMQEYWDNLRGSIREIVTRILSAGGKPNLKIVAYRDDCDEEKIIEQSEWCGEVEKLHHFISSIICNGGGDREEAVDRALQVAVQEQEQISSVILIGDAPPHPGREGHKEADLLGKAGCPVYSIVIGGASDTKQALKKISDLSGGKMIELKNLGELFEVIGVIIARTEGERAVNKYLELYPSESAQKMADHLLTDGTR